MPNFEDDYYQRLQISKKATVPEIKAAFRRLARRYHPDLNPNNPTAQASFLALREAYEVLIDQVLRERYDQNQNPDDVYTVDETPQTPQDFYRRGVNHAHDRQYKKAYKDYTEAIERQSDFVAAYLRRAQVRYVLGDDAGVLADCQRLLKIDKASAEIFYYQGLARYRLGYTQSAIAAFTEALTLDPDDPQIYYQRAIGHEDIQEMEQAIADFKTAQRYFQEQGDPIGLQRTQERLILLKAALSYQVPGATPNSQARRSPWKPFSRLGRFNRLFFGLLGNPAGEIASLHGQLSPSQATRVGCLLGLIAVASFTLSGHFLRVDDEPGAETVFALWAAGSVAFLSLILMLTFNRNWFRRRGSWSTDIFIAGATLLPVGIFALITPVILIFGPWLWLLCGLFAATQTILTLYISCTEIQHLSEQVATWIVPSFLFMSLSLAYVILELLR